MRSGGLHLVREAEDDEFGRSDCGDTGLDDHPAFEHVLRRHRRAQTDAHVVRGFRLRPGECPLLPEAVEIALDHRSHLEPGGLIVRLEDGKRARLLDRFLDDDEQAADGDVTPFVIVSGESAGAPHQRAFAGEAADRQLAMLVSWRHDLDVSDHSIAADMKDGNASSPRRIDIQVGSVRMLNLGRVIGNYDTLAELTGKFDIPFHAVSHEDLSRTEHEEQVRTLIDGYQPDYVILAKYMRVLTPSFVEAYPRKLINIHHSFLPAFIGARPYRQAFDRGVKLIGATAHFVTDDLDEGPIIEQDVIHVGHAFSADDMAKAGRDVEKSVLSRALELVLNERVFVYGNKTVVFK